MFWNLRCSVGLLWLALLGALGAVVALSRLVGDVVIGDATLGIRHSLVVIVFFWVFCDNVPGVDQARNKSQAAEEDIDERIGGAQAALHPDCNWWEDDGQEAEEDVAARHGCGMVVETVEIARTVGLPLLIDRGRSKSKRILSPDRG